MLFERVFNEEKMYDIRLFQALVSDLNEELAIMIAPNANFIRLLQMTQTVIKNQYGCLCNGWDGFSVSCSCDCGIMYHWSFTFQRGLYVRTCQRVTRLISGIPFTVYRHGMEIGLDGQIEW